MTPANDNRPAEFDEQLVRYLPGLRALALRLRPSTPLDEREDLVNSTVLKALENWHKYRPGSSPFPWLSLLMRGIARDELDKTKALKRTASRMLGAELQASLPNQEHAADMGLVLAQITPSLRAEFVEIAMGVPCAQLAAGRGVTKQRMDQIVKAEQARLRGLERRADTRRALAAWGRGRWQLNRTSADARISSRDEPRRLTLTGPRIG